MSEFDDIHALASRANTAEADRARMTFERVIALLSSGGFLYENQSATTSQAGVSVPPTLNVADMPDTPLLVPLEKTAHHPNPAALPVVAMLVDTETTADLQSLLTKYLVENNARPFCRPVFVTSDLRLVPFLGLLGAAICVPPSQIDHMFLLYLERKFTAKTLISLQTGEFLATEGKLLPQDTSKV